MDCTTDCVCSTEDYRFMSMLLCLLRLGSYNVTAEHEGGRSPSWRSLEVEVAPFAEMLWDVGNVDSFDFKFHFLFMILHNVSCDSGKHLKCNWLTWHAKYSKDYMLKQILWACLGFFQELQACTDAFLQSFAILLCHWGLVICKQILSEARFWPDPVSHIEV